MSDLLSKKTLFYTTCVPFFLFFAFFDAVIYPNSDRLHPSLASVESLLGISSGSGGGLNVLASIVAHWTSALFYVVAEIYSSVSVGLLFWQFANDVVSIDQAKRFYPLFAQMSGIAPVLAGQYVVHYASRADNFATSLHRLTLAISFAGCMICLFYNASTNYLEKKEGLKVTSSSSDATPANIKKKKPKMSMVESVKFLASSQYLRLIASLVLGYGLSINFTEVMWKSLVKKQYPNPLDYQRFMGNFSSAVGASTFIVIFFWSPRDSHTWLEGGSNGDSRYNGRVGGSLLCLYSIGIGQPSKIAHCCHFGNRSITSEQDVEVCSLRSNYANVVHSTGSRLKGQGQSCHRCIGISCRQEWRILYPANVS